MVDISFSQFASKEQIEAVLAHKYSQEALIHDMRAGYSFVKLIADGDITGFASYKPAHDNEAYVDKLYVLPGEHEQDMITLLVNNIREQARLAGYKLLSLFLTSGEQQKLELLARQGFNVKGPEKVEIIDGFQMDTYVLSVPLDSEQFSR
jgi:GNAT superfamily N-acetyltransferase